MPYINHKLGKTYYEVKGRGKCPLIALHGGPGGTCKGMRGFLDLAGATQKVLVYDQLGAGKSSATKQKQWTINTFVKELSFVIDSLKVEQFDLLGASWGTTLALEYYLRKKDERMRSIIFQSPMFSARDWENDGKRLIKKLPAETQKVLKYCHEIGATDSKVYQKAMFDFYLKHVLRDKKKLQKMFEEPSGFNNELYEYMWGPSEFKPTGTLSTYDQVAKLKDIKIPSMIICGEFDEATPVTGRKYSKMIPKAKFVEIKGCSHSIVNENKAAILKEVKQFLNHL